MEKIIDGRKSMSTSAFKLGLPTDIPWTRVCVTEDMIDNEICDQSIPPKWASSIAVFKYVPPEEYQEHDDYEISYLKVAVSIAGYVPRDREIEGRLEWDKMTTEEIEAVESLLNEYQPCTGALVQISVSRDTADNVRPENQPFFMDFEPKKRELFEMATDTQERSSRSLQTLSVGKSGRSTQSLEVLDIDMGYSISGGTEFTYAGTGGGISGGYSRQGEWGTKQVGSHESGVIRTVDNSTERREISSFTTQISQLYHLLDSYHLGTNRIVFLIEPRPHVIEQSSGFVRGPRPIDGVQEFFLVVATPKEEAGDYCVSVRLDTAHFTEEDIMDHETAQHPMSLSVSVSPPAQNDSKAVFTDYDYMDVNPGGERRYKCYEKRVEDIENLIVEDEYPGFKIDLSDSGGYSITSQSSSRGGRNVVVEPDGSRLTARVWATARKCYNDGGAWCINCPSTWHAYSANSSLSLVANLISKEPTRKVGTRKYLLVTTRGLCCCENKRGRSSKPGVIGVFPVDDLVLRDGAKYGLVLEEAKPSAKGTASLRDIMKGFESTGTSGKKRQADEKESKRTEPGMTIREANSFSKLFRGELWKLAASRRVASPTPVLLHDFFIGKLHNYLRTAPGPLRRMDAPVGDVPGGKGVKDRIARALGLQADEIRRRDLLSLPSEQLAKATGLSQREAAAVRMFGLGVPVSPVETDDRGKSRGTGRSEKKQD